MRLFFVIVTIICSPVFKTQAQTSDYMKLYHKSGATMMLALEQKPIISFDTNGVSIATERYSFSELDKYVFVNLSAESGLAEILGAGDLLLDSQGYLHLPYSQKDIAIYDMNGIVAECSAIKCEGEIIVDMSKLKSGIYLVSLGDTTFKVCLK